MRKMLSVGALAVALVAPSSGHADPVETQMWLGCNNQTTGVGNVDWFLGASDYRATLTENEPTATENVCVSADTFLSGTADYNPLHDFPINGEYAGEIKNLSLDFYAIEASGSRALNEWTVDIHLQINGVDVLKRPTVTEIPITGASTNTARRYEITVTDINLDWGYYEVTMTLYPKFVDGSGVLLWAYNSPEFPSNVVFNDTTPATKTIKAYS